MDERPVRKSDTLDVLEVWIYGRFVKQRYISSPRDIDCNAELPAGRSDGHRPEPASIIFALASVLVEGQVSGWRPVAYVVGVSGLLLVSIPVPFKLGRVLNL